MRCDSDCAALMNIEPLQTQSKCFSYEVPPSPFLTHWSCLCLIPLDSGTEQERSVGWVFLCVWLGAEFHLSYKYISEIIHNPICLLQFLLASWECFCGVLPILNNSYGSRDKSSYVVQYVFSWSFMYKVSWFFFIFPFFHIAVAVRYLGTA